MTSRKLDPNRPCKMCGKCPPEVEFHYSNTSRFASCKSCTNLQHRQYHKANRAKILRKQRRYYQENKHIILARSKQYYSNNRERYRINHKNHYENNKPYYTAKSYKRLGLLSTIDGIHTTKEWEKLKAYYNYKCLRCGRKEPEIKLTIDHVIPVSKGGSNFIHNIQPLCKGCNSGKRDRAIDYRPTAAGVAA